MSDNNNIFAIVPIDILQDTRLTFRQMRVLIALLSFRNKATNLTCPSRDKLSERCGLPVTRISEVTSELVDLGWLKKDGKGGFSKSTKYEIIVPVLPIKTVTDSVTVTKPVTVTDSVTNTVTDLVTNTVTDLVTRKEQTIKQTIKQTISKTAKNMQFFNDVSPQIVSDYLAVRKAKKAPPVSQTVFNGLLREANKAGFTIEQALTRCVERGWVGFNADWVLSDRRQSETLKRNYPNKSAVVTDEQFDSWLNSDNDNVRLLND